MRYEVHISDKAYPEMLKDLPKPPEVLYVEGDLSVLNLPSLSIIGARQASPYGLATAELSAQIATEAGLVVVSGGARGCDAAAGLSALNNGGKTIIVAGTGANIVYPESSKKLFERVKEGGGAVISQEHWSASPKRYAFPKRNKLIAALSLGLVVSEAGLKSGTLSTADAAFSLDRKVWAFPGSIFSKTSQGANYLIENGASIICDALALELEISLTYGRLRNAKKPLEKPVQDSIIGALLAQPLSPEELAHHLASDVLSITRALVDYEARGFVEGMGDGRFSVSRAWYLRHNS